MLQPVLSTYNGKGDGDYNYGRYSNAKLDELTAKIKTNMKEEERLGEIHDALLAHNAEINHHPAAPAGDPVGDAQQRHRGASGRQQRHPLLGDDPVAAARSSFRSSSPARPAISARTSASLRPVRAGTWKRVVRIRRCSSSVARAPSRPARASQELQIRELVARPLQEQHRNPHRGRGGLHARPTVARRDAAEIPETRGRGRSGSGDAACAADVIAPAKRPAACDQGQFGN